MESLTDDQVGAIAAQFHRAAADRTAIETLAHEPLSVDDGYRVQAAVQLLQGDELIGWKAGCTNEAAQLHLGLAGPVTGRYRAAHVLTSPAVLEAADFVTAPHIEVEVGLRLLRDLDSPPDDALDLAEYVEAFAAIEVVAGRLAASPMLPAAQLVADNVMGARMIVGPTLELSTAELRRLDALPVSLSVDGEPIVEATGAAAWGHPLRVLNVVADRARSTGDVLRAGQLVITGTCTGLVAARLGAEHVGRVGDAQVRVRID